MTERAHSALISLRRILRAVEVGARALSRETGLTISQLLVLQTLAENGEATAGTIAARVSLSQASVTNLLDRLEQRGYVRRQRGETDRRKVWIELQQPGRDALEAAPDLLQDRFQTRFRNLPEWEQAYLLASLERLSDLLDAGDLESDPGHEPLSSESSLAGDPGPPGPPEPAD